MDWGELLQNLLTAIIIPLAGVIGTMIARLIKKGINSIDNDNLERLAWLGVRWAEDQITGKKKGEERIKAVKKWIQEKTNGKFDDDTVEKAIRSAFQNFSNELGAKKKGSTA